MCPRAQAFELEKQLSKEAKEARALAVKFKDQTSSWIAAARRCIPALMTANYCHNGVLFGYFCKLSRNHIKHVSTVHSELPEITPAFFNSTAYTLRGSPFSILGARTALLRLASLNS